MVCLTSMAANGTVFGCINTFGILYVAMLKQYGGDDPNIGFKTSWVGSVCTGITFFTCMVSSILTDRLGIRKVAFCGGLLAFVGMLSSAFLEHLMLYYLTYGVVMGVGFSFAYAPSLVILGHYFKRRMGLVNGLVTFGSAVFTIVYSLVLPELLEEVGLKYSLLCLSGMVFLLMPYALTWKPLVVHENNLGALMLSTDSVLEHVNDCMLWTRKYLNVKIWRNRGYVIWALANGVSLFGYFIPFVHLVQHVKDTFPGSNGNLLPMSISITSGVSRIAFGLLSDVRCLSRVHMQQMALLLLGVTTMCIPFADSFTSLIIICLVMGLCDGLFICLLGPIAFDLVGQTGASQALGFLFSIFSIPMTIGPPLAGLSYDYLGSYRIAFHAAGAPPILGAIIMFLIPRHKQSERAVTDIEEFVAVSCPNIYNSRLVSTDKNGSVPVAVRTDKGGPSNTELIIISGEQAYSRLQMLTNQRTSRDEPAADSCVDKAIAPGKQTTEEAGADGVDESSQLLGRRGEEPEGKTDVRIDDTETALFHGDVEADTRVDQERKNKAAVSQ